jgi:hypothetical protein
VQWEVRRTPNALIAIAVKALQTNVPRIDVRAVSLPPGS